MEADMSHFNLMPPNTNRIHNKIFVADDAAFVCSISDILSDGGRELLNLLIRDCTTKTEMPALGGINYHIEAVCISIKDYEKSLMEAHNVGLHTGRSK